MNLTQSDNISVACQLSIRCQPDWEALTEVVQARAEQLGIIWQKNWEINRFSKYFSLILQANYVAKATKEEYEWFVRSMQPSQDKDIQGPFDALSELHISFGIRKSIPHMPAMQGLELIWQEDGLYFPSYNHVPIQQVHAIPLQYFIKLLIQEYRGSFAFKIKQTIDVSQHFHSPTEIAGWKLSRWRGDKSVHAITKLVRLELLAKK